MVDENRPGALNRHTKASMPETSYRGSQYSTPPPAVPGASVLASSKGRDEGGEGVCVAEEAAVKQRMGAGPRAMAQASRRHSPWACGKMEARRT